MLELLKHDPNIWIAFSFILLVCILYKYARAPLLSLLDSKIEQIRRDIENAENLRIEAQELLAQYQRKQKDAEKEAARILETAKKTAEEILLDAEKELAETIARRENQLTQRIERMKQDAKQEISNYAVQLAMASAHEMIEKNLENASSYEALLENSVSAVGKQDKILN